MITEIVSWAINVIAVIGWVVNIKHRKQAMLIFTVSTVLSIGYFAATWQVAFLLRSVFYLFVDIVTLWHIFKLEKSEC